MQTDFHHLSDTYTERSRGPSPDGGRTAFVATHRQQGQEGFLSSSFHSQDNQEGQFVCATGGHRWKTVEERDPCTVCTPFVPHNSPSAQSSIAESKAKEDAAKHRMIDLCTQP